MNSFSKFNIVIKKWRDLLIPGGILKIHVENNENNDNIEILLEILKKNRFNLLEIEENDIRVDKTITICANKEVITKDISQLPINEKMRDIISIISQNEELFSNTNKLCIVNIASIPIENYLKELNFKDIEIHLLNKLSLLRDFNDDYFDGVIVANFLEFNNYSTYSTFFTEIRRILKPNKQVLLIVPEKDNYNLRETANYFNKRIITQILDKENFGIEWINLSSSFKMIQILFLNQFESPTEKKGLKVNSHF